MIGNFMLRMAIWLLLTANFTTINIIIGIIIALVLPRSSAPRERLQDLLGALGKIVVAIPQAYIEAVQLILQPHTHEEIVMERVQPRRSPGLVFLDIFLITFTPKTTVLRYHEDGWYEVHYLRRGRNV
jgi:multicomponent Na+:H+ antiporter subunit E